MMERFNLINIITLYYLYAEVFAPRASTEVSAQTNWAVDLSDGKIFTTMEWLMVFVKVPL